MIKITPLCRPQLDPDYIPAALWNRAYRTAVAESQSSRQVKMAIGRPDGVIWIYETRLLSNSEVFAADTLRYCERIVKFLLWAWGGSSVRISNAPEVVEQLQMAYAPNGQRAFDHAFMGSLKGNRLGFDLGGSDRKCAAMIDGKVFFQKKSSGTLISKLILNTTELASKIAWNVLQLTCPVLMRLAAVQPASTLIMSRAWVHSIVVSAKMTFKNQFVRSLKNCKQTGITFLLNSLMMVMLRPWPERWRSKIMRCLACRWAPVLPLVI